MPIRRWSDDARKRIKKSVRRVEQMPLTPVKRSSQPRQMPWQFMIAKAAENIAAGESGDVTLYGGGTKGSETTKDITVTAHCRASVKTDDWLVLIIGLSGGDGEDQGGPWEAIPLTPSSGNGGIDGDPRDCIYPGADISSSCVICPCSADPWVINPGPITCGNTTLDKAMALFFHGEDGDTDNCIWESGTVTVGGHTFQWKLTVTEDAYGNISGTLELIEDGDTVETWFCEVFCCECRNCFVLHCANKFPPNCRVPSEICLATPQYGEIEKLSAAFGDCVDTVKTHCPDGVAFGWMHPDIVAPGTGLTAHLTPLPGSQCGWTGTICPDIPFPDRCDVYDLTMGDPNVVLTIIVWHTGGDDADYTITYTAPLSSWNCDADNDMTLVSVGSSLAISPAGTITLSPLTGLIDPSGNPVTDEDGNPIYQPAHDSCDPNHPPCGCCWRVGGASGIDASDHPYQWYTLAGSDVGDLPVCDASICNSVTDQLPSADSQTLFSNFCATVSDGTVQDS